MKADGEPLELFLWHKVTALCKSHHPESVPCVTLSDFVTDFPYPGRTSVNMTCPALEFYNDIFGKQDLGVVDTPSDSPRGTDLDVLPIMQKPLKFPQLRLGGAISLSYFMDPIFLSNCSRSIATFLEQEFSPAKDLLDMAKDRHKECLDAINLYDKKGISYCLEYPSIICMLQACATLFSEIDLDNGVDNCRRKMRSILLLSENILRVNTCVMNLMEFGDIICSTLDCWKDLDCTLEEACACFQKKHRQFRKIYAFTIIPDLASFHDNLLDALSELAESISTSDYSSPSGSSSEILYLSEFS